MKVAVVDPQRRWQLPPRTSIRRTLNSTLGRRGRGVRDGTLGECALQRGLLRSGAAAGRRFGPVDRRQLLLDRRLLDQGRFLWSGFRRLLVLVRVVISDGGVGLDREGSFDAGG